MGKSKHHAVATITGYIIHKDGNRDAMDFYVRVNPGSSIVWSAGYKKWRTADGWLVHERSDDHQKMYDKEAKKN